MDTKDICLHLTNAGITIRPAALQRLQQYIQETKLGGSVEDFLDDVVRQARELINSSSRSAGGIMILEEVHLAKILGQTLQDAPMEDDNESELDRKVRLMVEQSIVVLGAYTDFPYLEKGETDARMRVVKRTGAFFGEADSKIAAHRNHYHMMEEILLKSRGNYTRLIKGTDPNTGEEAKEVIEVAYINNLLGLTRSVNIMGTLLKKEEQSYYMEDTTKSVRLSLAPGAQLGKGFFLEGSTLIAHGSLINGTFIANELKHPPVSRVPVPKPAEVDYFGAHAYVKRKMMKDSTTEAEETLPQSRVFSGEPGNPKDKIVVILSNVYLDNHKIMSRLKELLTGLEQLQPAVVVLMGGFFVQPHRTCSELKGCFSQFGQLVSEFEGLAGKALWVLMPSLDDPGVANLFPRKPIPECLLETLHKRVPNLINATNPCRISFFGKEMVFCRHNMLQSCKRQSAFIASSDDPNNVAVTLMAQRCLAPISTAYLPV